jgi:solute carrier family 25 phosphate transporter 3
MYNATGKGPAEHTSGTNLSISLGSGVVAGIVAAIVSHPADTLLSKINKAGAGGTGGTTSRLINIAKEMGFAKLCLTGLGPRCVMIGTLTAGQFGKFLFRENFASCFCFVNFWAPHAGLLSLTPIRYL